MEKMQFSLNIDESNLILKALSEMPYIQVVGLIQKIRQQAESQLQAESPSGIKPVQTKAESKQTRSTQKTNGKAELV